MLIHHNLPHTKSLPNLGVLFTFSHLPWIHFLHFTHKTEFAITRFPQIPHGSTLLTFCPTHYQFCLPEVQIQPLTLECDQSFHCFTRPNQVIRVHLIDHISLTFSVTTSTTIAKTNGSLVHTSPKRK